MFQFKKEKKLLWVKVSWSISVANILTILKYLEMTGNANWIQSAGEWKRDDDINEKKSLCAQVKMENGASYALDGIVLEFQKYVERLYFYELENYSMHDWIIEKFLNTRTYLL